MDLDFDHYFYCWDEFLNCWAGVYKFLFIRKIHPNTEIRDRNLSPLKVVAFLYVGSCLWWMYVCRCFVCLQIWNSCCSSRVIRSLYKQQGVFIYLVYYIFFFNIQGFDLEKLVPKNFILEQFKSNSYFQIRSM